tara:strand:+ start:18714 stop:19292 length:579 start_codon:yes stop_codon:yes gene_type:complete
MNKLIPAILLLAFWSGTAGADWVLDNEESILSFTSTKANAAAEVHKFGMLNGHVDKSGNATLKIDLNSVDTAIELRDERMRELLFNTAEFPEATLTMSVDMQQLKALQAGDSLSIDGTGELSLHGTSIEIAVAMKVARLGAKRLLVASEKPVIINAASVGLAEGIEKLREVAGLPSISPAVPVTFVLSFERS